MENCLLDEGIGVGGGESGVDGFVGGSSYAEEFFEPVRAVLRENASDGYMRLALAVDGEDIVEVVLFVVIVARREDRRALENEGYRRVVIGEVSLKRGLFAGPEVIHG
jgi:hypothetical protein